MNIYNKLLNIQQELKAPKTQRNTFGGYNYRSCEDILEAVKPLLEKYSCVLTLEDSIETVGYDKMTSEDKVIETPRVYIKATATLRDTENDNETDAVKLLTNYQITNTAYAREEANKKGQDGSQITGASSSYARKYALNGLFAIDDTKDSDATNTGDITPKKEEEKYNCVSCGKEFTDYTTKEGKFYKAKTLYELSKKEKWYATMW